MLHHEQIALFYEDSDDLINASKTATGIPPANISHYHSLLNVPVLAPAIAGQKRVFDLMHDAVSEDVPDLESDANSSDDSNSPCVVRDVKRYKHLREHKMPDCVAQQLRMDKSRLDDVVEVMKALNYVPSNSGMELRIDPEFQLLTSKIPVMFFFFTATNLTSLKFFDMFTAQNVSIIGVTPEFQYYNTNNFPIVLDKNGKLAKLLRIRDPLGGGVYPIPTIILYDRFQNEVIRIQLGYDYNVYYDSSIENNLQNVLINCINYTASM